MYKSTDDLLKAIFCERDIPHRETLTRRIEDCDRFREFLTINQSKICKKVKRIGRDAEQIQEVEFELYIAFLMLINKQFSLEYEPSDHNGRTPDFLVTFRQSPTVSPFTFIVEVAGLRMKQRERKFNQIVGELCQRIEGIPSGLVFSLRADLADCNRKTFIRRLEESQEQIFLSIKNIIEQEKEKFRSGHVSRCEYAIPGFEHEYYFILHGPYRKNSADATHWLSRTDPIFFSQKENLDIINNQILYKLEQLQYGISNMLVIVSNSTPHGEVALFGALEEIILAQIRGDEEFFRNRKKAKKRKFASIQDFQQQAGKLSALLFIGTGHYIMKPLKNKYPLPDAVCDYFKQLEHLRGRI